MYKMWKSKNILLVTFIFVIDDIGEKINTNKTMESINAKQTGRYTTIREIIFKFI